MSSHPDREFSPAQLAAQDEVRGGRTAWQKKQALQLKAVRAYIASSPGATADQIEKATGVERRLFRVLQKNGFISISQERYYVRVAGETEQQKKERWKIIQATNAKLDAALPAVVPRPSGEFERIIELIKAKAKKEPNQSPQPTAAAGNG